MSGSAAPFSEAGPERPSTARRRPARLHQDPVPRAQTCDDAPQMMKRQGDASRRRSQAGPGDMQEDGAARARNRRVVVMAQFHQQIVQQVRPLHPFRAGGYRQGDGPIVVGMARIVAPAIAKPQGKGPQPARRRPQPSGAIAQPAHRPASRRGGAVALAFGCPGAAAPQRAGQVQAPSAQTADTAMPDGHQPPDLARTLPSVRPRDGRPLDGRGMTR